MKKINFKGFDRKEIEADYRDDRIRAVVAIDPGFALLFPPGQKLSAPAYMIFADRLPNPADEIYARDFLRVFGDVPNSTIPGSIHMSFLTECSEAGLKELVPICMGDVDERGPIHKKANGLMFKFLEDQK